MSGMKDILYRFSFALYPEDQDMADTFMDAITRPRGEIIERPTTDLVRKFFKSHGIWPTLSLDDIQQIIEQEELKIKSPQLK
jgi:hypothetical protein